MHHRIRQAVLHLQELYHDEVLRQSPSGCEDEGENEEEANTSDISVSENDLSSYSSPILEHLRENYQISNTLDCFQYRSFSARDFHRYCSHL